jgi:nucleoside-diphosphate-sugar epimerase
MAAEFFIKSDCQQGSEAVICRAPEFYGPGKTRTTNALIFSNLRKDKKRILKDD